MVKVQIVEDHQILVEGLLKLISSSNFAEVTATAGTGKEAMKNLREHPADVLLLDINLPDASGLELCTEIKVKYPEIGIIALTSYSEYTVVRQMMENGASGYVLKNSFPDEILLGIQMVSEGEKFFCDKIDLLMNRSSVPHLWLTCREKELLKFVSQGFTNSEIAEKLFLGVETVNSYRKNLLLKTGARNTAMLVKIALEQKLI